MNYSVMEELNVTDNPILSISPADPDLQITTWILHNATYLEGVLVFFLRAKSIADADSSADESVPLILLGVSVIAVFVTILLMMIVVLRYIAHQKGTYYTHEEALAFKSDHEVQDVPESQEDPEDEEP